MACNGRPHRVRRKPATATARRAIATALDMLRNPVPLTPEQQAAGLRALALAPYAPRRQGELEL